MEAPMRAMILALAFALAAGGAEAQCWPYCDDPVAETFRQIEADQERRRIERETQRQIDELRWEMQREADRLRFQMERQRQDEEQQRWEQDFDRQRECVLSGRTFCY